MYVGNVNLLSALKLGNDKLAYGKDIDLLTNHNSLGILVDRVRYLAGETLSEVFKYAMTDEEKIAYMDRAYLEVTPYIEGYCMKKDTYKVELGDLFRVACQHHSEDEYVMAYIGYVLTEVSAYLVEHDMREFEKQSMSGNYNINRFIFKEETELGVEPTIKVLEKKYINKEIDIDLIEEMYNDLGHRTTYFERYLGGTIDILSLDNIFRQYVANQVEDAHSWD